MDHKIVEAFMRVGKCHRTLLEHYLNKDGLYRVISIKDKCSIWKL